MKRLNDVVEKQNILFMENKEELKRLHADNEAREALLASRNDFLRQIVTISGQVRDAVLKMLTEYNSFENASRVIANSQKLFDQAVPQVEGDQLSVEVKSTVQGLFQGIIASLLQSNAQAQARNSELEALTES